MWCFGWILFLTKLRKDGAMEGKRTIGWKCDINKKRKRWNMGEAEKLDTEDRRVIQSEGLWRDNRRNKKR